MNIIITHGYTDSNKGDVAIAFATVSALRQKWPHACIQAHSNYSEKHPHFNTHARHVVQAGIPVREGVMPSPYLDDHGSGAAHHLAAVLRWGYEVLSLALLWISPRLAPLHPKKARALEDLKQADLVIVRGGQYLHNESGRIRGMFFLTRMLLGIAIPVWLGRPTVIFGLSVGPVHGPLARWLVSRTVRGCRHIVVREALSAEFLSSLGIWDGVRVAPDVAFLTLPAEPGSIDGLLPRQPCIGVTLINWSFPGHPAPRQALANYQEAVFETLVQCHQQYGLIPVLVEQVTAQHHGQHDHTILAALCERLQRAGVPAQRVDGDLTPAALSALYGQCAVVLATRLHSLILAACAGTPSVAIRYQGYKTQGIMHGLGLGAYAHDINTVSSQALLHSIDAVLERQEALRTSIAAQVARYRHDIAEAVDQIAALYETAPVAARAERPFASAPDIYANF